MRIPHATICIIMLVIVATQASALQWSEILFNPQGADTGKEFVELTGNESLVGCTIRDSHGGSRLNILSEGTNNIILIVTNPTFVQYNSNATIYAVGKSIITDLPNTADTLNITCNTTILTTSYNISSLDYTEGESLVFNGTWNIGPMNGTPGMENPSSTITVVVSTPNSTKDVPKDNAPDDIECNDSLGITISATKGVVGEKVSFTVISESFATYEVTTTNESVASGDTLQSRSASFILPDAPSARITAYATACGRKQRALRNIAIIQPKVVVQNQTSDVEVVPNITVHEPVHMAAVSPVTGAAVVVDKDAGVVPWICGFGAIVMVCSTIVFLQLRRESG